MKAMIQTKQGSPDYLRLMEIEKPTPGDHEVLIKVQATTVTSGDARMHKMPLILFAPIQMMIGLPAGNRVHGHEFAGTVEAVGKSVTKFKVGDAVFGTPKGGRSGTHTEYICLPEDGVLATIPASASYEEAAAAPIGAMTALQILRKGTIRRGQKALIYGASGSVGTYAIQLLKHKGAYVTGVCSTANVEMVKSLGADHVIDYTHEDFTGGSDVYDLIFDAVGKISRRMVKDLLAPEGDYVSVKSMTSEKTEHLLEVRTLLEEGAIEAVIDRRYTLEQIPEALRYVDTGRKRGNIAIAVADA